MGTQPSALFRRPFLACFMIGFVKLQLFIVALFAFGALVSGESIVIVVALQVILAAAFAWYDSAILDAIQHPPEQS